MAGVWVVLPTYNEAENVAALVRAIAGRVASPGSDNRVLVVDDASPDGTGQLADELAAELAEVEVLHRPAKGGLGPAYVAGFERALAGGAELVVQMDSDFSHDPDDLPRLLEAAAEADLVLGSRYVAGGGIADWGMFRRLLSRGGSWYARTILGVGVRDLTGGFKCFRREALEGIGFRDARADGYAFQIELTYRALRAGLRVREIPIVFTERHAGRSKMNARIAAEAVWMVPALRLRVRG
jgi:dolichol-phosphate mannosyltransferase